MTCSLASSGFGPILLLFATLVATNAKHTSLKRMQLICIFYRHNYANISADVSRHVGNVSYTLMQF